MEIQAGSKGNTLGAVAVAIAGLVVSFVLGALVGWPPFEDSRPGNDALGRMCTALDDLDSLFLQRMAEDEMAFRTAEHRRMGASLKAAIAYATATAHAPEADEELLATASDLHSALRRTRGDLAREHVDDLRGYC